MLTNNENCTRQPNKKKKQKIPLTCADWMASSACFFVVPHPLTQMLRYSHRFEFFKKSSDPVSIQITNFRITHTHTVRESRHIVTYHFLTFTNNNAWHFLFSSPSSSSSPSFFLLFVFFFFFILDLFKTVSIFMQYSTSHESHTAEPEPEKEKAKQNTLSNLNCCRCFANIMKYGNSQICRRFVFNSFIKSTYSQYNST